VTFESIRILHNIKVRPCLLSNTIGTKRTIQGLIRILTVIKMILQKTAAWSSLDSNKDFDLDSGCYEREGCQRLCEFRYNDDVVSWDL